ncbi:hypothetical protein ZWY2020_055918 [Hordeum vulgare]|nr:hypothetical protein ZWY2020_055918 [Hordeum vulgare]
MSAASSSSSDVCRRVLVLPLIRCSACKEKVCMFVSTSEKHDGWVFYKCHDHGYEAARSRLDSTPRQLQREDHGAALRGGRPPELACVREEGRRSSPAPRQSSRRSRNGAHVPYGYHAVLGSELARAAADPELSRAQAGARAHQG